MIYNAVPDPATLLVVVCSECGGVVLDGETSLHSRWHQLLGVYDFRQESF